MPKFSAIKRGQRNIKPTCFRTLDGEEAKCGLKFLGIDGEEVALERAIVYAVSRGGKAVDGDPLYELGKAIHLVEIAATDLDDPTGATPFFDGGLDQIRQGLDTERIFLLKELQRTHQEEASPHQGELTVDEYVATLYDSAAVEDGAALPFESWPLRKRRNFQRSMAKQLVTLVQLKSEAGSASTSNLPAGNA